MKKNQLPLFHTSSGCKGIYIHGVKNEIRELVNSLGGPTKTCALINLKYTTMKEWLSGRHPAPIAKLKELIKLSSLGKKIKEKLESKDFKISCRYSTHKINFPRHITSDLAYIIGLIQGDGSLAGETINNKGNWTVNVCFDNGAHCNIYRNKIKAIFGIKPNYWQPLNGAYFECYFASRAIHWFLQEFFGIKNGVKHDSIEVPEKIIPQKKEIIAAFMQGLFDSDGTIVPTQKTIKFASTSKKIIEQSKEIILGLGIQCYTSKWLKNENCKMLYELKISRKKEFIKKFEQEIGFNHPTKREKLKRLCNSFLYNSPVV